MLTRVLRLRRATITAFTVALLACGCAQPRPTQHGTMTTLSAAKTADAERCEHRVPRDVCTRCNPHLVSQFQAAKDWCPEHGVPESQCFECHPDLTFDPLPPVPANADLHEISKAGEDVPELAAHAAQGKVTLFDFYAVWCASCRKVDAHVLGLLAQRTDLAVRKLNVVDWETPLAKRHLKDVSSLPYVVVHGRSGRRFKAVAGLDLKALDQAIAEASSQ